MSPGLASEAFPLVALAEKRSDPVTNSAIHARLDAWSPTFNTWMLCGVVYPPSCRAWNRMPAVFKAKIEPLPATNKVTGTLTILPIELNTITSR